MTIDLNEEDRKKLAKNELAKKRRVVAKASMDKRVAANLLLAGMTESQQFKRLQKQIKRLAAQGKRAFGSFKAYYAWMDKPYVGFDGKTPNELACNYDESEKVYEAMQNIARGDLS